MKNKVIDKVVASFCKGSKISNMTLNDLYQKFSDLKIRQTRPDGSLFSSKGVITRADFELGMLKLGKKPALALKDICINYFKDEGSLGYDKLCKEISYVTKEFWDKVISSIPKSEIKLTEFKPTETLSKPQGPRTQPTPKSIVFDDPRDLKKELIELYETQNLPLATIAEKLNMSLNQIGNQIDKLGLNRGIIGRRRGKNIQLLEKIDDLNDFNKLLPINWLTMSHSDRVEFAQKVQHEQFKEYLYKLDPKIKDFISKNNSKKIPTKFKLYVTLFQFSPKNYSVESKNLLKCFVENLNTLGRSNLQYIECTNPPMIEIREIR